MTVADAQGRYVTDLGQDDFSVFEDGAKQELTYFNRTNLPIALSLLIDSSASMEQRMENAQEAAIGFAKKLRPQDLAQVVDFDSRVEIKLGFTNKVDELESAIHATSAGGSTALHNAVYIALKELAKIKAKNPDEIRRQAIVVLSDGEDTSSLVTLRRSAGAREAIGDGDLHDRPAAARDQRAQGIPRGRVRAAPARAGNRRPRVLRQADR